MTIYVLHPGHVASKTDGDIHYIRAGELARCFGLYLSAPNVIVHGADREIPEGAVHLYPRYSGDYSLPKEVK